MTLEARVWTVLVIGVIVLCLYQEDFEEYQVHEHPPPVELMVPNIVHFIRFGPANLTFIDAVCILAALKNQRPDKLVIHTDQRDFHGGKYWNIVTSHPWAKGILQVDYLQQPENIFGKPLSLEWRRFHAGDVARLQVLTEHGGIFLDNDSYIVQNLSRFFHHEMTMGWMDNGGISNQVLIAKKNARFLKVWLNSYRDYRPGSWFFNAGELPTAILKKTSFSGLIHREKRYLAEYRDFFNTLYLSDSDSWRSHLAIHLNVRQTHLPGGLTGVLTEDARYPVIFNETNILRYPATIRRMVLDVYPYPLHELFLEKHRYSHEENKNQLY